MQPLRRALVERAAQLIQIGLAELVGGVEALGTADRVAAPQLMEGLGAQELHERLVRGVAADDPALGVKHGLGVLADGKVHQALDLAVLGKLA